jgi:hypothetical protein
MESTLTYEKPRAAGIACALEKLPSSSATEAERNNLERAMERTVLRC